MSAWYWLVLAWVAFGSALAMVLVRRNRQLSRHFPYEPRAELLRQALENQWPVRFEYWSQAEGRWLRRKLKPVSLAAGHLRAEDKHGHSRRYEVTRMRLVRVRRRCVRPPWRWQVPLAGLLGAGALALSLYAGWERSQELARRPVGSNLTAMQWWQNRENTSPPVLARPTNAVLPSLSPSTQAVEHQAAGQPLASGAADSWKVILEKDSTNSFGRVVGALQSVLLQARPQAIFLARQAAIHGRVEVWTGPETLATNYAAQLQRLGFSASVQPLRP